MSLRHTPRLRQAAAALGCLGVAGLAAALAGVLGPVPAQSAGPSSAAVAARLLPRPQYLATTGVTVTLDASWRMVLDTADDRYAFDGAWFNEHAAATAGLTLAVTDGRTDDHASRRIVVGNPDVHPYVREALEQQGQWLPDSIGDEGYVVVVAGGSQPAVVVAAHAPNGAFYGVVTVLGLLGADATLPGVHIVDYPDQAVRGTYEPGSAAMGWEQGRNVFTDRQRAYIDWMAQRKLNTLFLVDNGDFFQPEDTWVDAYEQLFAYARQRFIEPVPRICSISTVAPFPFEYYEGWPVANEPFTFDASDRAVADVPASDAAPNGNFEVDADQDGVPDGWAVTNRPGATWSLDTTYAATGTSSMRLDIPAPTSDSSSSVLSFTLHDPMPNSYYCLWTQARAKDIVAVQPQLTMYVVDSTRKVAVLQSDVTGSTSGWIPFGTCLRTPADPATLTVYARIQSGGSGTYWLDDVHLARMDGALQNVIRAHDTDISLTDAATGRRYLPGQDFDVQDGATAMRLMPSQAPFVVHRLPDGEIATGTRVLVSYDAFLFTHLSSYWSSAPCVAHEELYTNYYEPAIDGIVGHLHPKMVNIDADEIRGFYRDSRMLRRFSSNAEAIAYWANRIRTYLATKDPSARLWIWDDMVSPYHNGGVADYQVNYGGQPGRMAESTEQDWIDKSVVMDVWWYGDEWLSQMWRSIQYFGSKGYDVLGSPWLDKDNIASWSEMLVGQPHALGGVDTNWGTPFEEAQEAFAQDFWNTRYRLVLFDSFESDVDGDGVPDGWQARGPIDYSTDGSMVYGRRYAGFPLAAVGVLSDTQRLERAGLAVRPLTRYVLSAYLRSQEPSDAAVPALVTWRQKDGRVIEESRVEFGDVGDAYGEHEADLESPPAAAWAAIAFEGSAADIWIDVLRFKEELALRSGVQPALIYLPFARRR